MKEKAVHWAHQNRNSNHATYSIDSQGAGQGDEGDAWAATLLVQKGRCQEDTQTEVQVREELQQDHESAVWIACSVELLWKASLSSVGA